jgi:hypothetical protein
MICSVRYLGFVVCLAIGSAAAFAQPAGAQETKQQKTDHPVAVDPSLAKLGELPIRKPTQSIRVPDTWDIGSGSKAEVRPFISPDGTRVFVTESYQSVRVWAALVANWPYSLIFPSFIILLFAIRTLRRQLIRVQIPGETYCANCNYHLAGSESEKCPECGVNVTEKLRAVGRSRKRRIMPAMMLILCIPLAYGSLLLINPNERGVGEWFSWQSEGFYLWALENGFEFIHRHDIKSYRVREFDLKTQQSGEAIYDRHDASPALAFSDDSRFLFVVDGIRLTQWNIKRDEEIFSLTAYEFDEPVPISTPQLVVSADQRNLYSYDLYSPPLEWNLVEQSVRELPWRGLPKNIKGKPIDKLDTNKRPQAVELKPWPYYNLVVGGSVDASPLGFLEPRVRIKITDGEKLFLAKHRAVGTEIQVWDIRTRKRLQRVASASVVKGYFAPSSDGKRLFMATIDDDLMLEGRFQWSVHVWDTTKKKWIGGFRLPSTFGVGNWFMVARDRPLLIVTGRDRVHESWPTFIWHFDISEFLPKSPDAAKGSKAGQTLPK